MHTLVLGGIRSGKSAAAERCISQRASDSGAPVVYVATGSAGDGEMSERIRLHQQRRPASWGLLEEPLALGAVLVEQAMQTPPPCLLIDCMSLWLSNLLHAGESQLKSERAAFLGALQRYPGDVVIVSNEVGLGTIAMDPLTRHFADQLGWLNQSLAEHCQQVRLCIAGLEMSIKNKL